MDGSGGGPMEVTFSIESLKEPRGFIRVLEVILSIFAFATTTGHSSSIALQVMCDSVANSTVKGSKIVNFDFHYSYDLEESCIPTPVCSPPTGQFCLLDGSESSAQFYVFVGVIVFLYCLATLGLYVFFDEFYRRNSRVILMDFLVSAVLTFFWLVGSCAWATGVTDVKMYTDFDEGSIYDGIPDCAGKNHFCQPYQEGNYASLNVSLIFGFLNFMVWIGNLWFLYKETQWFKSQQAPPAGSGIPPTPDYEPI